MWINIFCLIVGFLLLVVLGLVDVYEYEWKFLIGSVEWNVENDCWLVEGEWGIVVVVDGVDFYIIMIMEFLNGWNKFLIRV